MIRYDRKGSDRPVYPPQEVLPDGTLLAARLTPDYYAVRDPLIQSRISRLLDGEPLEQLLKDLRARLFDERVVEYLVLADWLLTHGTVDRLLDVGCVLNNKLVSTLLPARVEVLHLCNPAPERLAIGSLPVEFHRASLRAMSGAGRQFERISCISTIEHIGYDNSQYGLRQPATHAAPQLETLVQAMQDLSSLTAEGGRLLLSVPYGFREVLTHPVTRRIGSQVFDFPSINEGIGVLGALGFETDLRVFQAYDNGWCQVSAADCRARYAQGCPAAAAVAFVSARRVGEPVRCG